jgi:hypothetical protein
MYLFSVLYEASLRLFGRHYGFGLFPIFLLGALLLPHLVEKLLEPLVFGRPYHALGPLLIVLSARF